jgi:RNA polymerase sigma factor (sigma-70 family)
MFGVAAEHVLDDKAMVPMGATVGQTHELERCLELMRCGDPDARNEIVTLACERLRKLTKHMLRGYRGVHRWSETDDVLQGAMMRLHRSLAEVQPDSVRKFFGLAATQIRRELIDLFRHHYSSTGPAAKHHSDGGEAVERSADLRYEPSTLEDWTAFHEQIDRLPDEQREVFDLLWYKGLTQPAAAEILGMSLATLKRRWQSARILLHDALKDGFPTV